LFYRCRKINDHLLKELENNEMFFCPPEKLNDPLDGELRVYWKGTQAQWKGLIYHYACILCERIILIKLGVTFSEITNLNVTGYREKNLPYKIKIREKLDEFFISAMGEKILGELSKGTRLHKSNITFYFAFLVHKEILKILFDILYKDSCIDEIEYKRFYEINKKNDEYKAYFDNSSILLDDNIDSYANIFGNSIFESMYSEIEEFCKDNTYIFILISFTKIYFECLEQSAYFKWGIVSLSSSYSNPVLWANYADSHKGVCLVFDIGNESNDARNYLFEDDEVKRLRENTAICQGTIKFKKVKYTDEILTANFFDSLGAYQGATFEELFSYCKEKDDGNISQYGSEEWRKEYWDRFQELLFNKTKWWEYEKEYRLVLDGLHDRFGSDGLLVKFKSERLKAIIFGVKTSPVDKRKIVKLVNEKYNKNSKSVEFYQATYIPEDNSIEATVHFSRFNIL